VDRPDLLCARLACEAMEKRPDLNVIPTLFPIDDFDFDRTSRQFLSAVRAKTGLEGVTDRRDCREVLENATPLGQNMIDDGTYNWDSHAVNCHIFKDTKHKLGFFDRAISALIRDLYDRGLDRQTAGPRPQSTEVQSLQLPTEP